MRRNALKLVLLFTTLFAASPAALGAASTVFYKIHVDPADTSGFDVEMRFNTHARTVRVAMAAHPEYDDRYWRYIENFTAESRGRMLQISKPEAAVWKIVGAGREIIIK